MTIYRCDICKAEEAESKLFCLKLWKGQDIYGFNDVCPLCAAKIKKFIEDLKEGEE